MPFEVVLDEALDEPVRVVVALVPPYGVDPVAQFQSPATCCTEGRRHQLAHNHDAQDDSKNDGVWTLGMAIALPHSRRVAMSAPSSSS